MDKKEIDRILSIEDAEEYGRELDKLTEADVDEICLQLKRRGEKNPDYSIWESLPEGKPLSEYTPGESIAFFIRKRSSHV